MNILKRVKITVSGWTKKKEKNITKASGNVNVDLVRETVPLEIIITISWSKKLNIILLDSNCILSSVNRAEVAELAFLSER